MLPHPQHFDLLNCDLLPSTIPCRDVRIPVTGDLPEKSGSEIIEATAPGEPFVGRTRRLEVDIVDARFGERFAELLRIRTFDRSDSNEKNLYLFVEGCRVCKNAVTRRLRIKSSSRSAAAAEASKICEFIKVAEHSLERLHASHGQPGHGTILPAWQRSVCLLNHRNEIGEHHLGERPSEVRR